MHGVVVAAAGPWRTAGEWWREEQWTRDEWDVAVRVSEQTVLCRLVRQEEEWWVEGVYD